MEIIMTLWIGDGAILKLTLSEISPGFCVSVVQVF